jgi:glucokinase
VDPVENQVVDSPNLRRWEGFPLAQRLEAAFRVPTFLENDVNSMAYGEWKRGAGRGTRHMLCLALGTGVGGGIILDGKLYRGARGAAGELGHTTLDMHGPHCSCPNVGCLERHIGSESIVAMARQKLAASTSPSPLRDLGDDDLTPGALDRAAEAGDSLAAQVFEDVGALLGQGLVSLVNVFDPERVVLGGGVMKAGAKLLEPARRVVRARAMSVPARYVEIVPAELGDDAALIGATLLAAERVAG